MGPYNNACWWRRQLSRCQWNRHPNNIRGAMNCPEPHTPPTTQGQPPLPYLPLHVPIYHCKYNTSGTTLHVNVIVSHAPHYPRLAPIALSPITCTYISLQVQYKWNHTACKCNSLTLKIQSAVPTQSAPPTTLTVYL